jgi:site-specific DNA-methyltransferase (adenine-specific)
VSLYYQDDFVTLYHGDCLTEHREWLAADVLVTDLPYGYDHSSNWEGKFRGEIIANDSSLSARDEVLSAWGKSALVFGSWKRPKPAGTHTVLIWDKGENAGMGDLAIPWKPNAEEVYVIGRAFRGRRSSSILTGHSVVTWASKGREHPNMKPVSLMERLIEKCLPGTVADPFAGSGSTLVAAKNLGRKVIGVELEEKYCEVIAKRCAQDVLDFGASGVA